jgi:type IV pilus assembly protein PilM
MGESIWKKEISFRRKTTVAPEPKPAKESVWKKEISLRRAPESAEPKESIWKKEISLGRKRSKPETPVLEFDLAPAAEAVWSRPPEIEPEPEPPVATPHVSEPEPVDEPSWHVAEPVVEQLPPIDVPSWHVSAAQVEPLPEPEQVADLVMEHPPADSQTAEVVEVEQPEPAVDEQGVPEPEEPKVSFWRKERSLKRAPKQPEPPAEPSQSFWKKDRPVRHRRAAEEIPQARIDLALGRTEPAVDERWLAAPELPAPAEALEDPAEPKVSFWRREHSLKRSPKKPKPAVVEIALAQDAKTPFWRKRRERDGDSFLRRERSLTKPKMSVPKRASGAAGGSGSHAVKRYVGLKIGSSQIAAARVSNNGAAELLQVAREPLAHGVVVNGELRDPEALAEALKRFFARNKLPRKNVRLGIASSRIGVRVFDIAGIDDDKQLENAIRFRAQETLPIPLDEAVLDYHILGESVDEQGNPARRVLLVVAYRDLVDRYVAACRKAGVSLIGIDLEAFALLRALAAPKAAGETSDAAFVAVAIGHDRSTFAVSDGRVCEFTRVIEWGGASLSVAIARVLDMAPSEVESIKRLVSLDSETVPEGIEAADYTRAVEAVNRQVQGFARELVSSLQFYQGQPGSLGIGEIVITGGTANLAGLAGELERQIGVRVRVGDPLARLKVGKKISADEHVGSLAVAIGLGIED